MQSDGLIISIHDIILNLRMIIPYIYQTLPQGLCMVGKKPLFACLCNDETQKARIYNASCERTNVNPIAHAHPLSSQTLYIRLRTL